MSGQGKTWKLYNREEELMELWKAAKNDCEIAKKWTAQPPQSGNGGAGTV
jgi:hypothetical protein